MNTWKGVSAREKSYPDSVPRDIFDEAVRVDGDLVSPRLRLRRACVNNLSLALLRRSSAQLFCAQVRPPFNRPYHFSATLHHCSIRPLLKTPHRIQGLQMTLLLLQGHSLEIGALDLPSPIQTP